MGVARKMLVVCAVVASATAAFAFAQPKVQPQPQATTPSEGAAGAAGAAVEPTVVRIGTIAPAGTPWEEQLRRIKKQVESESGGTLQVKVMMGAVLGDEPAHYAAMKRGEIEIFAGSAVTLAPDVPEIEILELPFLFDSESESDFAVDTVLHEEFETAFAGAGIVPLLWAEAGYHVWGSRSDRCIMTPEEFKKLRMRSQDTRMQTGFFQAMGANVVPLGVTDVLSSLQAGLIDGLSTVPVILFAAGWYSSLGCVTDARHMHQPALAVASSKWFMRLSPSHREIIVRATRDEVPRGRAAIRAMNRQLMEQLGAAKVTVRRLTEPERAAFASRSQPVHEAYAATSPRAAAMLGKLRGALAKQRTAR